MNNLNNLNYFIRSQEKSCQWGKITIRFVVKTPDEFRIFCQFMKFKDCPTLHVIPR